MQLLTANSRKVQFLAIRVSGASLLQLQSLATGVGEALHKKFVSKEWVELHNAKFHTVNPEQDEKLASLLTRLISQAYPEQCLICQVVSLNTNL